MVVTADGTAQAAGPTVRLRAVVASPAAVAVEASPAASRCYTQCQHVFHTHHIGCCSLRETTQASYNTCCCCCCNNGFDGLAIWLQVAGYGTHNTYVRDNADTVRVTRDQIVESVDKSLQRLQTDYVDLLQIHWCGGGVIQQVVTPL